MAVLTRKDWVALRDKNNVKMGASKVSMGKSLDEYHKTAKGMASQIPAAAKLTEVINAYLKDVKNPAITKALKDMVSKELDPAKANAPIVKLLQPIIPLYKAFLASPSEVTLKPLYAALDKARDGTKGDIFSLVHTAWKWHSGETIATITGAYKTKIADAMKKIDALMK